jgi:glycine/D-amino acid oxidase-like deaminating enzyme/nitrite reductase/ring-hydroxylating ferredoxin subunit
MGSSMELPGKPDCCWNATAPPTNHPALTGSHRFDVAIIGAGIVGLTAAYRLAGTDLSVAVLEADRIGRQVTGRSSAKITSQHALIYRYLIDMLGLEQARLYADANRTATRQIRSWIDELRIACDLEVKNAYTFTCHPRFRRDIETEGEAARSVGFKADVLDCAPLPFDTAAALVFPDEAQFNPARYLIGLADAAKAAGAHIYENTRVTAVDSGKRWRVEAGDASVDAQHVVMASHLPFAGPLEFDYGVRTRPRCHAAMAFRIEPAAAIDGMFISIDDPTHSLRMGRDRDGPLLIALGPRFDTGRIGDVAACFRDLEEWVRANLAVGDVAWRWVNEDYETDHRVPFVSMPEDGFQLATGFNGWGISNGTAAAMLMADRIRGQANPWASLFDPNRPYPEDFNPGGDTQSRVDSVDDIAPGAGGVIERGKKKIAVWKDDDGTPHALSAKCTHEGCTVTWNNADRTWDCPCHGSMFERDGRVRHGPAVEPLAPAELPG